MAAPPAVPAPLGRRDATSSLARLLARFVFPCFRAFPCRGLGRLRPFLPVPRTGTRLARFRGGVTLRLDLSEAHQRDLLFGLYDDVELSLLRPALADGGDFVDVGAHIGFYSVAAAQILGPRGGHVLALEPNPAARAQLLENLRLNAADVDVVSKAASNAPGAALLHVPTGPDASISSLGTPGFEEGTPIPVELTTVEAEVVEHHLAPAFVKIDVEGHELAVLEGADAVISAYHPTILCEVGERTAEEASRRLARHGYRPYRIHGRRLISGLGRLSGIFNVLFVPRERLDTIPHP